MKKKEMIPARLSWNGVNPITKKMPTLVEKQRKQENKHKKKWNESRDGCSTF